MITGHSIEKKAAVIGAGLGGLATAIALQQAGLEVTVFDKAPELLEAGAGIVLAANAMKVLDKLGVADQVRSQGSPVKKGEIRTWNGSLLVDVPVEEQAQRYGTYSYLIHRAELQTILFSKLAPGTVQFAKKLVDFNQNADQVNAEFADGSKEVFAVLIGADGIFSEVRKRLIGVSPLRYSGFSAVRGIAYFEHESYPRELGGGFEAWGRGKRFGFSHLGKGRIFWFAAINSPQGVLPVSFEPKKIALQQFEGWCQPVEAVIQATHETDIVSHDIFDRTPTRRWSEGRVTLLGDAAHPMLPNLGQGGAQAMEDAWVLARCLDGHSKDVPNALAAYEQLRMKRTERTVHRSRMMGKLMQLENPLAIRIRDGILQTVPASLQVKQLDWLVGYQV